MGVGDGARVQAATGGAGGGGGVGVGGESFPLLCGRDCGMLGGGNSAVVGYSGMVVDGEEASVGNVVVVELVDGAQSEASRVWRARGGGRG